MYQGGIFLRGKCSKIYINNSTGNYTWDVRVHYIVKTRSTLDSIFAIIEIKTRKINFISKIYSWSLTYPRNFSVKRRSEPFQSPWWTQPPNLLGTWTFLSCSKHKYGYSSCTRVSQGIRLPVGEFMLLSRTLESVLSSTQYDCSYSIFMKSFHV